MKPMNDWPNGLVYHTETDIKTREYLIEYITRELRDRMRQLNRAIDFIRVETPCLIPQKIAQPHIDSSFPLWNVSDDDLQEQFYLRPESTHGTYAMFEELFPEEKHLKKVLPLCIWQAGLSFRIEQDKTFRNLRFKQFYQLEFQMAYAEDTKANYHAHAADEMETILCDLFPLYHEQKKVYQLVLQNDQVSGSRDEDSLPFYSSRTTDLYVDQWEVVAISSRTDFRFPILEISCGLDRLLAIYRRQV